MKSIITLLIMLLSFGFVHSQVTIEQMLKADDGVISAVRFSDDGRLMAVASGKYVEIFLKNGESPTASYKVPFSKIDFMEFSSSKSILVSGSDLLGRHKKSFVEINLDKKRIEWTKTFAQKDLKKFQVFQFDKNQGSAGIVLNNRVFLYSKGDSIMIPFPNHIQNIKYSRASKTLWVYDVEKNIIAYKVGEKRELLRKQIKYDLVDFAITRDGKSFVYSDKKKNLYYSKIQNNLDFVKLNSKRGKKAFQDLAFSWDGKYLSSSTLFSFQMWTISDRSMLFERKMPDIGRVTTQFDPTGMKFFTAGQESKLMSVWDCKTLGIAPFYEFQDETDQSPPQIVMTNPKVPKDRVSVTTDHISLEGLVIDNVGILEVKVNGQKTSLSATGDFKIEMNLMVGENKVNIEATDINNNTAVKKITLVRKAFDLNDVQLEAVNHLLIISIDDYTSWPTLTNAVSDGNHLTNVLMNKYNFNDSNVIRIQNKNANRQGIINGFRDLISAAGPNDNVIVYFSGHGYFDPSLGEGYWVPADAVKGQDGDYLPNSFMMQLLKKVNSKHLFLIADACFSGSLFNETSRGYTESVGAYKSRWGLTSGRLEYVSDGAVGEQSPFNRALVDYLENNQKDAFAVSELVRYVKVRVANETNQAPVGNPLSGLGDEGGEFVFKLKK